jgi:hypothetical protein
MDFTLGFMNKIVIRSNESGDTYKDITEFTNIIRNFVDLVPQAADTLLAKHFLG